MGSICTITIKNHVNCVISGLNESQLNFLWNKFGIYVEGYFWMPKFKLGIWDGKIRFFDKKGNTYTRLLDKILPYIFNWGYDVKLNDKRIFNKCCPQYIEQNHFHDFNSYISLRPYQVDAINCCIENESGFIIAGTGSGKSLMLAGLCDAYGKEGLRTVTVVPSSDLVSQTKNWYEILGLEVGEYCGDNKQYDKQHTVATWQALQYNKKIMSSFQMFAIDEAHGAKASVISELINENAKHIPFRFGFTGTFPKPEADRLSLLSSIGPILREIPVRWLIDNKYLSEIEIIPIRTKQCIDEEFPDYIAEREYLTKSVSRLNFIANTIIENCEKYGNTLVLVSNIQFGKRLNDLIKNSDFLYGETQKQERKMHYDIFEKQNNVIKIATTGIASIGISIDRVFCLILIDIGKSFIRAVQSVGRGSRLAFDKNKVYVIDVGADLKWSRKHMNERLKYFKDANYIINKIKICKIKDI